MEICVVSKLQFLQILLEWSRMDKEMIMGRDTWWTIHKKVRDARI